MLKSVFPGYNNSWEIEALEMGTGPYLYDYINLDYNILHVIIFYICLYVLGANFI